MAHLYGRGFNFELGKKSYIMGILNFTPDSFADGGRYFSPDAVAEQAMKLEAQGADILDLGACSTAPGRNAVSENEELERVKSAMDALNKNVGIPISIDTFRPSVAELAISLGANIINDESGAFSEDIAALVKKYDAGWIAMHTGGSDSDGVADYPSGVVSAVCGYFDDFCIKAAKHGIESQRLCFDPGIGFGKSREDDMALLASLADLKQNNRTLLIGLSGKRVIREICGEEKPEAVLPGVCAANAICALGGVDFLRVHDVAAAVQTVKVASALRRRG